MPPYFPVRNFVGPNGNGAVHVWVPQERFTLERVLCLAQALANEQQKWKDVVVLIFTSEEAAEKFDASGMSDFRTILDAKGVPIGGEDIGRFRRELRALYVLDREAHTNQLTITPVGLEGAPSLNTTFDLPVTGTARCRLEVKKRCLLSLEPINYPGEALTAHDAGAITLNGVVARDGSVMATIAASDRHQESGNNPLAQAALHNLSSWWLEPASHVDSFQVTYSYVIDPLLATAQGNLTLAERLRVRDEGYIDVRFALPERLTIRGYPSQ